jgi:hypothetical protein
MSNPLASVREKIFRAEEHLAPIKTSIEACLDKCHVISERDPDVTTFRFTLNLPTPDLRLSIMIGECLHNLRSALDHIVWQLVLVNTQTPIKENMFPVCETVDGFNRQASRQRLHGISVAAQTLIEGLQPYAAGYPVHLHPLWVVNQLNNIDKHRALVLAAVYGSNATISATHEPTGLVFGEISGIETLRDGAIITIRCADINLAKEMNMQIKTQLSVVFEETPVNGFEVNSIMCGVVKFIKDRVIPTFEPLLG